MVLNQTQKAAAKKLSRQKKFAAAAAATATDAQSEPSSAADEQLIALPTQQRILDVFDRSLSSVLRPDGPASTSSLDELLQEIKAALVARDFAAAFENARPELLEAYAARWSPTRALGYAALLVGLKDHFDGIIAQPSGSDDSSSPSSKSNDTLRVASIGGGAAEVGALAGFLLHHHNDDDRGEATQLSASITLLDSAPWSPVVSRLHADLTTPTPLSKYASAAAKAANAPLVDSALLSYASIQADVLSLTRDQLSAHLGLAASSPSSSSSSSSHPQPLLVTLLFTLNELYTTGGIGKTTALLLNLSAVLPPGSLLLVVDSPGSYPETTVGKESKRYPMHWLLEHSLLKTAAGKAAAEDGAGCRWEKVASDESAWFRMHKSLRYPVELEDMPYQMHLYRARPSLPT